MKTKRIWILSSACAVLIVVGTLSLSSSRPADAYQSQIVGAWRVTFGPPGVFTFPSYLVFHIGGTMTEKSGFLTDTMSSGVWQRIGGFGKYAATFEGFQEFQGRMIGFRVRVTLQIRGKSLSGTATGNELDFDTGEPVGPPFAVKVPVSGSRLEVLPE